MLAEQFTWLERWLAKPSEVAAEAADAGADDDWE